MMKGSLLLLDGQHKYRTPWKKGDFFFNISHKAAKYTRIRVPRPIRKLPINVHDMTLIVKILKIHKETVKVRIGRIIVARILTLRWRHEFGPSDPNDDLDVQCEKVRKQSQKENCDNFIHCFSSFSLYEVLHSATYLDVCSHRMKRISKVERTLQLSR